MPTPARHEARAVRREPASAFRKLVLIQSFPDFVRSIKSADEPETPGWLHRTTHAESVTASCPISVPV